MALSARSLRSDAARNRELLLAAAEEEFAKRGMDASVADIARRAGVAKGTVFRHFATKEELVAVVVGGHFVSLSTVAGALLESADPTAALLEFLTVAAQQLQHQDLAFLQEVTEGDPTVTECRSQLHAGTSALVDRAQEAGGIRSDVTGADILLLLCALVHTIGLRTEPTPDSWRRHLIILFDGLRPQGASPLPDPAPERL
ncbi:TetR/AcrR family transcriptional regulator [Nocardiopsis sp. MG754419]|uniref:TetR/AcrR family transcriptional regulator n=1 Tax=Nocardiopsis sp. MG754419 TaxID=2259865 RepID=UPI001BABB13C|nr:TetR/AcrR family transcriptional regulator [Nocardiopsis sp. MG754419]MBR8740784.1 TetR family transcriptional regulator [Nocardiopsis sp. MG754419]